MSNRKAQLVGMTTAELSDFSQKLGYSAFRGRQIAEWLYRHGARTIQAMTNIPAATRRNLSEVSTVAATRIIDEVKSKDRTTKFLLQLQDGQQIESVYMPYSDRSSVCVSSQVGCAVGCLFCATGKSGFVRNLTAGGIVDQVLTAQSQGGSRITNVVFMGMGEPLLNFDNVVKAVHLLNDEVGIGMRKIALSTVGITPMISRLMQLDLQLTLAVSLHAADDQLRQTLIPISRKYPLRDLISCCREYARHTKRRITFEYLLISGINDSPRDAQDTAHLLRGLLCNVNLIPYNEVPGLDLHRPDTKAIRAFRSTLHQAGIEVTQRMERGHSVAAACGQLRRRHQQKP